MLAARGDELQPILESKCAGEMQRRVFAKAEARVGRNFLEVDQPSAFRRGKAGNAGDVNRRLADVGLIEPVLRSLEADFAKVEADDLVGAVEDFPRRWR